MRTRQRRDGAYETQSVGFAFGVGVGKAVLAICAIMFFGMIIAGGAWNLLLFFGLPLLGIALWHRAYYRKHPEERPGRNPGPWD